MLHTNFMISLSPVVSTKKCSVQYAGSMLGSELGFPLWSEQSALPTSFQSITLAVDQTNPTMTSHKGS